MKFPMRSLVITAAFVPAIALAQDSDLTRDDYIRQAEMMCTLAPEICEGAIEEINREAQRAPDFQARGPITYSDVVKAGSGKPKPPVRQNTTPAPRPTPIAGNSGRRTPTPTPPRPRTQPTALAPEIPESVAGLGLDLIVTFPTNRWQLDAKGKREVMQLAASMKRAESLGTPLILEIEGHSSRGREGRAEAVEPWNLDLSTRRAETVKAELLKAGVKPEHILAKGYGSSRPLAVEGIAPTDKVNQRVQAVRVK
jgi:OOP family OmpA-OmpF porin